MTIRRRSSAGFSLIEVALALGLVAFALVAIVGLIPVGLNSNQASTNQTAASTVAAGIVADLLATPVEIPAEPKTSLRYQVPLPVSGSATHSFFLCEDGAQAGSIDANLDASTDPRYRATLFITAPTSANQKTATLVRILITWPAVADPQVAALPAKYSGSYEVMTALNRN
jgi:type II secretory pathway pseudopilin PulG